MNEFDVVIIGGGPGGYAAAIRCSQLGLSVALAEQEALGGTCLNWGCIPTKSLLQSADLYQQILDAETFGISVGDVTFDLAKMVDQSRQAAQQLSQGVAQLMKKNKVKIFSGEASQLNSNSRNIGGQFAFNTLRLIVTVGWAIYPIGYFIGYLGGGSNPDTVNIIYNIADFVNKTAFGLAIWAGAKMDTKQ